MGDPAAPRSFPPRGRLTTLATPLDGSAGTLYPPGMPPGSSRPRASLLLVLVTWALLVPGYLALRADHRGALVDDAFISFRYAARWASGRGLTWNDGEAVEGYSNPLWTVLLGAVDRWGGVPPHRAAPWVALLFLAGIPPLLVATSRRRGWTLAGTALALAVGGLDIGLLVWGGSGLETALTAFLVALGIRAAAGGPRPLPRAGFGLVVGLLAVSRPEGALWVLVAGAWLVWGAWEPGAEILAFLPGAIAPAVGLEIFRLRVYGAALPNTFFAKVDPDLRGLGPAASALGAWGVAHAGVLAWLAVALLVASRRVGGGMDDRRPAVPRRFVLLPAGWLAAEGLFVLLVGGDWMGKTRYLAPLAPALGVLAGEGSVMIGGFRPGKRWALALIAAAATLLPGVVTRDRIPTYTREGEAVGTWLRAVAATGDTVAVTAAGAIPYFSKLPAFDVLGINDARVRGRAPRLTGASSPGHRRYDIDALLAARPRWIVWDFGVRVNRTRIRRLQDPSIDPAELDYRRALLARPEFRDAYRIDERAPAAGAYTVFRREKGP